MDASCFCCQFSLNTAGIIIGVYEIVQYTVNTNNTLWEFSVNLSFFQSASLLLCAPLLQRLVATFSTHLWPKFRHSILSDDSNFLTIVTCCLCALIITSALLVYGSFKVNTILWQALFVCCLSHSGLKLKDNNVNCISLQNIRRYVVSWIVVVVMIVVIQ
jgi:hypothetical protein